jgi:hypothetical protein
MTKPTNLQTFKKKKLKDKAKGTTLCRNGFHQWVFDEQKQFDVKSGKLISLERCKRCGKTKTTAS